MRKVVVYSCLLIAGLLVSQVVPADAGGVRQAVSIATMVALSFIMIHVGYEFDIDKSNPRRYLWDYVVAGTAATFPWVMVALYMGLVMAPASLWAHPDLWRETLLQARFASPTSAGILFSMLAAAGLGATWVFGKARVLAIFDDLDTILLLIPIKVMIVGFRWPMLVLAVVLVGLLALAWRYLHALRLPATWPHVLAYSGGITIVSELFYRGTKALTPDAPMHLEVLLPAFVLGCVLARPDGHDPHSDDAIECVELGPPDRSEQQFATLVSGAFMVLVGLSMPPLLSPPAGVSAMQYTGAPPGAVDEMNAFPGWGVIAVHVAVVTVLCNLGKMFPLLCYRREATLRERLALSICMWPRGEVGAGVLVVSLGYGIGGPSLTVAIVALAVNLVLTGVFIAWVKRLLRTPEGGAGPGAAGWQRA